MTLVPTIHRLLWSSALLYGAALLLAVFAQDTAQGWITLSGRASAMLAVVALGVFAYAKLRSRVTKL